MARGRIYNTILPLFMVLINVSLSILVIFLMRHIQDLLNSDVRINLTEIVTQNKDAITSRLMMNLNSLEVISTKINQALKTAGTTDPDEVKKLLMEFSRETKATTGFFVADNEGTATWLDGVQRDVSGRSYFRLAIAGIPNISDKIISRVTGEEVFIISVPLYYDEDIIGTIQRVYSQKEMYTMCSLSLYSAQGYMYVVNSGGYTILHSAHEECCQHSDNFFRDLFAAGNANASQQLKNDVLHNRDGFMETVIDGKKIFSAYTPIDKIHDWYLITSVPYDVVSPNGKVVITIFFIVLFVIVFIFSSIITYFLWYKNRQSTHLEKIAFVDPVTNGDTYAKFMLDATKALQSNAAIPLYILKFDIDNFKYINNFYGFDFGDQILRTIYMTIHAQLAPGERLARISSDHFVALLNDAGIDRIISLLSSLECNDAILYFSAGVYSVVDRNLSLNLMVDKAATAAESVKNVLTQNIAYYSDEFEQKNIHNEQLKRSVQQAIENKEFVPFYQPKVDINTLIPVGGEALVRWITQEGKFVSPGDFIPMCEQTGIVVKLDMLVYEKVLVFLQQRIKSGLPCIPISVNFSRLHLFDEHFFSKITAKLQEHDVPANLIELELTESAIFDNMELIYAFTEEAHSHGFLLAMDDFGSGYSSLHMLKDVPIDVLKIDKGFLSEAKDNTRRNIIFSSIADMANKLNIKIVVEGVEYIENVELMRACGCSVAQGYYYARPMNEHHFTEFLNPKSVASA